MSRVDEKIDRIEEINKQIQEKQELLKDDLSDVHATILTEIQNPLDERKELYGKR